MLGSIKAHLVDTAKDINRIRERNNSDRTITFDKALKEVLPSEADPIRMNLLRIEDLRNNAAHLFIDIVPPNVLLICQAGILNYEQHLHSWFGRSLCDRIPLGMIFLVSEFDPSAFSLESPALAKRISPKAIAYLRQWQSDVKSEVESLADNQVGQYAVKLDLKLSLVKNPSKAEILASLATEAGDTTAVCIQFQRPIDKYPYSYSELVAAIKTKRPGTTQRQINAIISNCSIKDNPGYAYRHFRYKKQEESYKQTNVMPSTATVIYSIKAVGYIISQLGPMPATATPPAQLPISSIEPGQQVSGNQIAGTMAPGAP